MRPKTAEIEAKSSEMIITVDIVINAMISVLAFIFI